MVAMSSLREDVSRRESSSLSACILILCHGIKLEMRLKVINCEVV